MSVVFKDYSFEVKNKIKDNAVAFLHEAAGAIVSRAKRTTRVGTGQLKNSWTYEVDEKNLTVTIGSPLENALWEELGTGEYALKGKGRKKVWYVPVKGYKGKKKPTYNGQVVIVYGKQGTAFYKTNGKKPQRTLFKAFETQKGKIIKQAEKIMKGLNE